MQDRIWIFQERTKGYTFWGAVDAHIEGGWNQNASYSGLTVAQANALSNNVLQTNSFFQPFYPSSLYGTNGSTVASNRVVQSLLLAEAIPAVSCAAGGNAVVDFGINNGTGNIDMMNKKKSDGNNGFIWPVDRLSSAYGNRWLHGDFKEVAYYFVYPLFDDVVTKGALK